MTSAPQKSLSRLAARRVAPDATDLLAALEHAQPIAERVVAVVAHPDDETIGIGSRLALFRDLDLIHVTDGAPADMTDARRAGFADRESYRLAREAELHAALAALCARARLHNLGVRDQEAVFRVREITRRLVTHLKGAAAVITHPYEGGHPDHDACALAVQLACDRLGRAAPVRLEFAAYHLREGDQASQVFWPTAGHTVVSSHLTPGQRRAKADAFSAFRSQADIMACFSCEAERFREAPRYDFTRPPPPGQALYDRWGWALTSAVWRREAARALAG